MIYSFFLSSPLTVLYRNTFLTLSFMFRAFFRCTSGLGIDIIKTLGSRLFLGRFISQNFLILVNDVQAQLDESAGNNF